MRKITPYLWFDGQAEEAATHYVSIFKNARVVDVVRMGPDGPALTVTFEIDGQRFVGLNGGPQYTFTEAVSLYISCADQDEVDELWERLSEGGEKGQCGWLKDRYGLSWQVIPDALGELMSDPDPQKAGRVGQAMMTMTKIDIQALRDAYDGVA
jgi:predicted 3-demethylubiquinone-9 3-methyltransferase (glyoxalase superfamily)